MSMLRWISRLWKNYEETSETPLVPELKTQYFNETKNTVMSAVMLTLQKLPHWKTVHVDDERGEITVETRSGWEVHDITITVFDLSPLLTALDVVSAKRGWGGDLGQSYRNIMSLLNVLHGEIKPVKN